MTRSAIPPARAGRAAAAAHRPRTAPAVLRLALAALLAAGLVTALSPVLAKPARTAKAGPSTKSAETPKASRKVASSRVQLRSHAANLAAAVTTVEAINDAQLEWASRVYTGTSDCEFGQKVQVEAVAGRPGFFNVALGARRVTMTPKETTTGAVRLEDGASGLVWIQIPTKSMLMDAKRGQRVADQCLHATQRAEVAALAAAVVPPAATLLGAPPPGTAAASAPPVAPMSPMPATAAPVGATPAAAAPASAASAPPATAEPPVTPGGEPTLAVPLPVQPTPANPAGPVPGPGPAPEAPSSAPPPPSPAPPTPGVLPSTPAAPAPPASAPMAGR